MRRPLVLLAVAAALWCSSLFAQQSEFHLREDSTRAIPDSFSLTAVTVSPAGTPVLLFDGDGAVTVLGTAAAPVRSPALAHPMAAVLLAGDTLVEAIDTARGRPRVVRVSAGGAARAQAALPLPVHPGGAAYGGGAWWVGGTDETGTYRLFRVALEGSRGGARVEPAAQSRQVGGSDAHLSWCGGSLLAASRRPPFRVVRLVGADGPLLYDLPIPETLDADTVLASVGGYWTSAPAVCLDGAVLQTLADLRSDRRVLVLYDAAGKVARRRVIDVPLAVVASVPGAQSLIAVRRAGAPELVWYGWRRSEPTSQPTRRAP